MKKLAFTCLFFVISISCFAKGHQEEEKRIEAHVMSNPNVASVKLERNTHNWAAVIQLKNGGLIKIEKCDMEGIYDGVMMFEQFGDYQIWANCIIKGRLPENENCNKAWYAASVGFSEILHTHFNCIDDFINNYDIIIDMLQKLANESKEERKERWKTTYTDSNFLNSYGNYENANFYGYVFAHFYSDDLANTWYLGVE